MLVSLLAGEGTLIEEALRGIGLIGLSAFGIVERGGRVETDELSFSSSELLCFRRVPARTGENGLFAGPSTTIDFGLYFGKPEPTVLRGLKAGPVRLRVLACGEATLVTFIPVSSTDAPPGRCNEELGLRARVVTVP